MSEPGVSERIFTPDELRDKTVEQLAGMFAAKEAVLKAMGLQAGAWHDIKIAKKPSGKPFARVAKKEIGLSISHDGDYAIAIALCLVE